MNKSLSIILPVHNLERQLQSHVEHLLEILPEFATEFEILSVDDGSTDLTEEVATELARDYPQVRVLRRSEPQGQGAAIEAGLARTSGEIVFVADGKSELTATDLRRLWDLRDDSRLVLARTQVPPRPIDDRLLSRLIAWGDSLRSQHFGRSTARADQPGMSRRAGSVQMIRREAIESLTTVAAGDRELTVERDELTDIVRMVQDLKSVSIPPIQLPQPLSPTGFAMSSPWGS